MTDIHIDGYPLYGISNHAFTFGFPCIHISDWQMKIMDILNSIIVIRVFFVLFFKLWTSIFEFIVDYCIK